MAKARWQRWHALAKRCAWQRRFGIVWERAGFLGSDVKRDLPQGVVYVELTGIADTADDAKNVFVQKLARAINFTLNRGTHPKYCRCTHLRPPDVLLVFADSAAA